MIVPGQVNNVLKNKTTKNVKLTGVYESCIQPKQLNNDRYHSLTSRNMSSIFRNALTAVFSPRSPAEVYLTTMCTLTVV